MDDFAFMDDRDRFKQFFVQFFQGRNAKLYDKTIPDQNKLLRSIPGSGQAILEPSNSDYHSLQSG